MSFWKAAKTRLDSWVNLQTGLGGSRDRSLAAGLYGYVPLSVDALEVLYHAHDLPARIVEALPQEALRVGFSYGDEALDKAAEKWRAHRHLLDAAIWGRLYGGAAIYVGLRDARGRQHEPIQGVIGPGDVMFLQVYDRSDLSIVETEPSGRPRMFGIAGSNVHPSRLILFGGARTGKSAKQKNSGWDLSVLQRPIDILRDADQSWRAVMNLLGDLSQAVFKVKGLVDMITDGRKDVLLDRMEIVDVARSVARAVVLDADGESFEHIGAANLTGVDPLLMRVFQRLAAAAQMPVTVLMGMSPAGLNATGESDIRIWYASAESYRREIEPQILRLGRIIAAAEGLAPPVEITWPALWTPTDLEIAQLELAQAQGDQIRIASEVVTPEEVARVRYGGQTWTEAVDLEARVSTPLEEPDPQPATDETDPIQPGAVWLDTEDGHRLEISSADERSVYYRDLDSDKPGRQWRWARPYFLERCRPAPETPADSSSSSQPAERSPGAR